MRLLRFFTPVVVWVVLFLPLAGAPTVAADEEPARLLVVTVANGYVHEVIPVMEEVIETLGRESGLYAVDFARTNEALKEKTTPEALEGYENYANGEFFGLSRVYWRDAAQSPL